MHDAKPPPSGGVFPPPALAHQPRGPRERRIRLRRAGRGAPPRGAASASERGGRAPPPPALG